VTTNALGHQMAAMHALDDGKYGGITLGAYRAGKRVSWVPGATIDVWTKCARQEHITGVPWPHCHFIQTIGGDDGGSIHCPPCRAELAAARAARVGAPAAPAATKVTEPSPASSPATPQTSQTSQEALPF